MSARARAVALAVAGLAAAALLGLAGYLVSRDTIALPATTLPAGDDLAPPLASTPATGATTTGDDARDATTTGEDEDDEDDDSGRGRGRGRGGDSDSGGSGRGRGRGGDD